MSNQLDNLADAESKLQQQQHLTEISDVSKGIAHALRNPMHTIGLAIEQLQNSELPQVQKNKLFSQIQSKIVQLDKNIKALLAVTSDGLQRDQTLLLSALIQDVILELKQTHNNAKGKLEVHLELDRSIKIVGAESEFRSIIHTLIFNAYEASLETINDPEKQDQDKMITLKIKTYTENELAVISIIDFGSGLTKDIESKLFTAHCSTKAEGAGMGLYISKRLVELYYDGTLTVENNLTENSISGVTATCTLPSLTL
jgi:signal transduction histidine kinase